MTKSKTQNSATEESPVVDEVNPLDIPGDASDLPATWEKAEGENLPALPDQSAPLDREDFITPKLHLGQRTGELGTQFGLGCFILNKEIGLTKKIGEELKIIVLRHPVKFFMEHLDYEVNGPLPRRFHTVAEVEEAGLTLQWDNVNNIRPTADRAANVLMLILKPEAMDDDPGFSRSFEGIGHCALASWLLMGTSYKSVATRLFTAEQMDLQGKPLSCLVWKLKSVAVKGKKGEFYVPQISLDKRLPDETVAALKAALNLA